jgi:hypothetical protein
VFSSLVNGRKINTETKDITKLEALEQYNDFVLCRELHLSYHDVSTMPRHVYSNFITILNLEGKKHEFENRRK